MIFLRFRRFHPDFETPREKLFAISDAGKVKMIVEIDYGGEAVRDSASRLVALYNSPKNEARLEGDNPDLSLLEPHFNSPDSIARHMADQGFEEIPVSKDEFEVLYQHATPGSVG